MKAWLGALAAVGLAAAAASAAPALADDHRTKAPAGAELYFIGVEDGASLSNPVTIRFGLKGMGVAPAGIEKEKTGHHHLLINQKLETYADPIPNDETHRHFGGGQTEVTLDLPAGTHTLQLVLGDQNHIPHDPPIESKVITVTVK
ncbi:MAG: DUF4399 domain-containing protein [Pseudomonadota bacterium]